MLGKDSRIAFLLFETYDRPCTSESGKSVTGRALPKPSISAGPICGEVDNFSALDATVTTGKRSKGTRTADPWTQFQRSRSMRVFRISWIVILAAATVVSAA